MGARVGRDQGRRDESGRARVRQRHHRPRARHHPVALVLAVRRVRQALQERIARVMERARERRVHVDVEGLEAVAVVGRIEDAGQRLRVRERFRVGAEDASGPPPPSSPAPVPCSPRGGRCGRRAASSIRRACASPSPRSSGHRPSTTCAASYGGSSTRSKNAGSTSFTRSTIGRDHGRRPPWARPPSASCGASGGGRSRTGCAPST